ncbi:MAG: hypothetical protein FWD27_06775 [Coriobacteriia bacterium]|nr:hypothetical protein [Coriobacteriia bacterium]
MKRLIQLLKKDFKSFSRKNESERAVLESFFFSAYRGAFVIRMAGLQKRSFCLGALFIQRGLLPNDLSAQTMVKHEYGHYIDLKKLGLIKYLIYVGRESVKSGGLSKGEYYNKLRGEASADFNVGIVRSASSHAAQKRGNEYINRIAQASYRQLLKEYFSRRRKQKNSDKAQPK